MSDTFPPSVLTAEEQDPQKHALAKYLRYSSAGLQFAMAVGLFTWGGIWLDGSLGTGALFTLLGLALGFGGGLRALYLEVYATERRKRHGTGPEEKGDPPPAPDR